MTSADLNNKAQTLLKRENRYLKVGGLICIALAAPALFYLSEQVEVKSWQQYETLWEFAPLALVYFCGANLFALGLIVLFAGFSDLPLFRNARARKGLLVKLAGANLLTVTFALLFFGDPVWAEESWVHSLGYLLGLGLFAVFARAGVVLIRRGWKHDAIGAEKLLEQDTRRPVVYVRSFKDDSQIILASGLRRWLSMVFAWTAAISAEQELAIIMDRVGPVVAIGRPGEPLPELGAARLYSFGAIGIVNHRIKGLSQQHVLIYLREIACNNATRCTHFCLTITRVF